MGQSIKRMINLAKWEELYRTFMQYSSKRYVVGLVSTVGPKLLFSVSVLHLPWYVLILASEACRCHKRNFNVINFLTFTMADALFFVKKLCRFHTSMILSFQFCYLVSITTNRHIYLWYIDRWNFIHFMVKSGYKTDLEMNELYWLCVGTIKRALFFFKWRVTIV